MLSKHFPEVDVIDTIDNIPEAIERVKSIKPDLIFLDIELPPYTGFNLLEETRELDFHTIFTTSFNQYAIKAFKFSAVHYLEKPYGLDDMREAMDLYKKRSGQGIDRNSVDALLHNLKENEENQVIGFPILGGLDFISVKDILWCKADNNYTQVRLTDEKRLTVSKTLKKVESLLSEYNFFRVHNSYLINLNHMRKYRKGDGGEVVMSDGYEVDVSRNRKEAFLEVLKAKGVI